MKKLLLFIVSLLTFGGIFYASDLSAKEKSINITNPPTSSLTMKQGSRFKLKTNLGAKARFSSSRKNVISVSSKGVLSAKKSGKAKITVKQASKKSKSAVITVNAVKKFKKATSVVLSAKSITLNTSQKKLLKAFVLPKKATVKKVEYKSSNTGIATVSKKGMVSAKKAGTAKITVFAGDGHGKKNVCLVTVKQANADTKNTQPAAPAASSPTPTPVPEKTFTLASGKKAAQLYIDKASADYEGLSLVAESFADDVKRVADADIDVVTDAGQLKNSVIIAGNTEDNSLLQKLEKEGKIKLDDVRGKWEVYKIDVVEEPFDGVEKALVIAGSDKRGTMYGLFSISELMGVSPWIYWADVNPLHKDEVSFKYSELRTVSKEPSVKYRGIFLNDEEPALGTWVNNKFKTSKGGKFNEYFYQHVYELLLRLKANYLWPAMWNASFGADGSETSYANAELADKYGIVMGTSHHEPMMLAHQDWVRNKSKYGNGQWNWVTNEDGLRKFFKQGAENNGKYDNLCTIGMRGDGDATMLPEGSSVEENVSLLKTIITAQKEILKQNGLEDKPTMLALYKEVEEYWYGDSTTKGLKDWDGLNDTIVMLAEDNYGNIRSLPNEQDRGRAGGWGMYYHFDYNGAPASYQWTQTFQLQKVWEQMSMAYDYGVDDIWIVNVGDLKPMEMPISYFLDMAYDFDTWGTGDTDSAGKYQKAWLTEQFGNYLDENAINDISGIMDDYFKLVTLRKPEIVASDTYSLDNYNEAAKILDIIESIKERADKYKDMLPEEAQAAYFQLVYYPAVATTNVIKIQIYTGINARYAKQKRASTGECADTLARAISLDKTLARTYSEDMPGGVGDKWNGMMAQAVTGDHIGYTSWRPSGTYPRTKRLSSLPDSASMLVSVQGDSNVHQSGSVDLEEFTSINKEVYNIEIANGGTQAFNYEIVPGADWIRVSKENGTVTTQDTIQVSVDFEKLTQNADSTLVIKGNAQTVTVKITAKIIDVQGLERMTHVEAHDYIAIEAGRYAEKNTAASGAQWKEIRNYGRTGTSMKVFPTTEIFDDPTNAPYVEYKFYVDSSEKYSLQTYIAPSNNVNWDNVTMKFAYSVDGNTPSIADTLSSGYIAGTWRDSVWSNAVRNNIRTAASSIGNLDKGIHTIRIYAVDPAVVLEKLVIHPASKKLKDSYLGPEESYYIGK